MHYRSSDGTRYQKLIGPADDSLDPGEAQVLGFDAAQSLVCVGENSRRFDLDQSLGLNQRDDLNNRHRRIISA